MLRDRMREIIFEETKAEGLNTEFADIVDSCMPENDDGGTPYASLPEDVFRARARVVIKNTGLPRYKIK